MWPNQQIDPVYHRRLFVVMVSTISVWNTTPWLNLLLNSISAKYRGSISAEHGLGFKKANAIHFSKSQSAITLMQQIKQMMDPKVWIWIWIYSFLHICKSRSDCPSVTLDFEARRQGRRISAGMVDEHFWTEIFFTSTCHPLLFLIRVFDFHCVILLLQVSPD